jgi:hypothetical protein
MSKTSGNAVRAFVDFRCRGFDAEGIATSGARTLTIASHTCYRF